MLLNSWLAVYSFFFKSLISSSAYLLKIYILWSLLSFLVVDFLQIVNMFYSAYIELKNDFISY